MGYSEDTGVSAVCGGVAQTSSEDATVLQFHMEPWTDPESGVARVEVAVGDTPGDSNVMSWTQVQLATEQFQVVVNTMAEGTILYATARATNGVGIVGYARSDGTRLLCQAGTVG